MWPDRVLNPGPLTYESGALPTVLRGSVTKWVSMAIFNSVKSRTRSANITGVAELIL